MEWLVGCYDLNMHLFLLLFSCNIEIADSVYSIAGTEHHCNQQRNFQRHTRKSMFRSVDSDSAVDKACCIISLFVSYWEDNQYRILGTRRNLGLENRYHFSLYKRNKITIYLLENPLHEKMFINGVPIIVAYDLSYS